MDSESPRLYKFGAFCLDVEKRLLLQNGEPVPLTPKAFDTLIALIRKNGRVVKKDELLKEVWPDTFVEEATLAQNIFTLRKALGQNGDGPQYIETIPRHGYRFAAEVHQVPEVISEVMVGTLTRTHIVSEEIERSNPPNQDRDPEVAPVGSELDSVRSHSQQIGDGGAIRNLRKVQPWIALALVPTLAIGLLSYYRLRKDKHQPVVSVFGNPRMRFSKLTSTGKVRRAAISPDGKYMAFVQSEHGKEGMWIRQIASSRSIPIVEASNVKFQGLTFAPDGASIYYDVYDKDDYGILYQLPVLGGASRKVFVDLDSAVSFSPDGKKFAFIRNEASRREASLIVAETDTGKERKLASASVIPVSSVEGPSWSPDGKVIVCPTNVKVATKQKKGLVAVDPETGIQHPINSHLWDAVGQIAWAGNGRKLLLTAWDSDASLLLDQLWEVSYPDGEARMLSNDLNSYAGVSLTSEATSLVTIQSDRVANFSIFSKGEFDKPVQITSGSGDKPSEVMGMSWTADNRIVYGSSASGNIDVWIMNADGNDQKQLTADPYINFRPSTSADGRTIVFVSRRDGSPHLWKVDIDGRNPVQLTKGSGETLPSVSPDGSFVVYVTVENNGSTLWKLPLDGGEPTQILPDQATRPSISPDGKSILCLRMAQSTGYWEIAVTPVDGSAPVKTFKMAPTMYFEAGLRWLPGGQGFTYVDNRDGVSNIWSQPLSGEAPKKLTSFDSGQIFRFGWSLDGQMLAVDHGVIINDVVMITNFA